MACEQVRRGCPGSPSLGRRSELARRGSAAAERLPRPPFPLGTRGGQHAFTPAVRCSRDARGADESEGERGRAHRPYARRHGRCDTACHARLENPGAPAGAEHPDTFRLRPASRTSRHDAMSVAGHHHRGQGDIRTTRSACELGTLTPADMRAWGCLHRELEGWSSAVTCPSFPPSPSTSSAPARIAGECSSAFAWRTPSSCAPSLRRSRPFRPSRWASATRQGIVVSFEGDLSDRASLTRGGCLATACAKLPGRVGLSAFDVRPVTGPTEAFSKRVPRCTPSAARRLRDHDVAASRRSPPISDLSRALTRRAHAKRALTAAACSASSATPTATRSPPREIVTGQRRDSSARRGRRLFTARATLLTGSSAVRDAGTEFPEKVPASAGHGRPRPVRAAVPLLRPPAAHRHAIRTNYCARCQTTGRSSPMRPLADAPRGLPRTLESWRSCA